MVRVIAGLAALLTALCLATGALAHASLVSAEPADGSVLTQAPKTVQLRFNESVTPAVVSLIDAAGKARDVTIRAADQIRRDRLAGRSAAGHADRQLSRGLAGRPSRGGIAGVFDRRRDRRGAAPASDHLVSPS